MQCPLCKKDMKYDEVYNGKYDTYDSYKCINISHQMYIYTLNDKIIHRVIICYAPKSTVIFSNNNLYYCKSILYPTIHQLNFLPKNKGVTECIDNVEFKCENINDVQSLIKICNKFR